MAQHIVMPPKFQSTHPIGCDYPGKHRDPQSNSCFNPRTPVGCDSTPTTRPLHTSGFNPRTHVGCDAASQQRQPSKSRFNPRTPVGCDRATISITIFTTAVSIPAPTWGATESCTCPAGSMMFQSTHPRGVRLMRNLHRGEAGNRFNPRTPVGCDPLPAFTAS